MKPALPRLRRANTAAAQDAPAIPAGYTAYTISGPGINAPPLPFRIEGDHLVMPDDPNEIVSITESRIEENRLSMTLETPGGPATFVALRDGDAFVGYLFMEEGEERGVTPISRPIS